MSQHHEAQILDLTNAQTLYELAIEKEELFGTKGAKLLSDLKEKGLEAEYTHAYFHDPLRPGIIWFTVLGSDKLPSRARLNELRELTDKIYPDFLEYVAGLDDVSKVQAQTPPLSKDVSGLELVMALEYMVFVYPEMVRAWAALIFTYQEILQSAESARAVYEDCIGTCPHAQVVGFLLGDHFEAN